LPLFAACFFLGAVSIPETLVIYGMSALTAVLFALLGLAVSAWKNTSHAALVTTYLLILLLNAGPWIPFFIFQAQPAAAAWIYPIRSLSPLAAMASVIVPTFHASPKLFVAFAGGLAAMLFGFLLVNVHRQQAARSQTVVVDDARQLSQRKLRFPFYLIDPLRRRGHMPDWVNPVFAKEMRAKALGGGIWIFRSAYLCFAGSMVLMALVAGNLAMQSPDVIRAIALVFQLGLIVLVVPSLTVGAITQERERGNLDLLRQTRISPVGFLTGKWLVACLFVSFIVIGALPLWFTIHFMHTNTAQQILTAWAVIGSTVLLSLAAGLFGSAVAGKTSSAAGIAYGLLAVLCVGTLFPFMAATTLSATLRDQVLALNPFVSAIQRLTTEFFAESRELWKPHVTITLTLSVCLLVVSWLRMRRALLPEP